LKNKKLRIFLVLVLIIGIGIASYIFIETKKSEGHKVPLLDNRLYKAEIDTIAFIRKQLKKGNADLKTLKQNFEMLISTKVFPYWYGTEWDFNGTTETPNKGKIACGYFVTTTLRDMGVPINRVKMAQCASEEMITSLAGKKNVHRFSNVPAIEFEKKMLKLGTGIYVIGLDNHTGFIHITGKGNFFIHASGWFPFKVVKNDVASSSILNNSKYKVVGKISGDEAFLRKWVE
jgi:hypothetical protein